MDTIWSTFFTRRGLAKLAPLALPWAGRSAATDPVPESFPAQPAELVREMVTAAHGDFERVKELVEARPSLAKAAVDWGFGDWEDALGAASHVGHRELAGYLIGKGARPSLFSAAMLGQLETVKAFLAAQPGAQRIPGPHSISLLAHAKAGGKQAEAVYQYLESLGDAGAPPRTAITAAEAAGQAGVYVFGPGAVDRVEIREKNGQLWFTRVGKVARGLVPIGDRTFHPVGAEAVRIRFSGSGENAMLTVEDGRLLVTARRM